MTEGLLFLNIFTTLNNLEFVSLAISSNYKNSFPTFFFIRIKTMKYSRNM